MIVKVTNKDEKDLKDGELGRKDIWEMVQHHRLEKNPKDLKYAHFKLKEILQLFINNKVLPETIGKLLSEVIDSPKINNHGVKIYLGRHAKPETCPKPSGTLTSADYLHRATTIILTTNLEKIPGDKKKGFRDMLTLPKSSEEHFVLIPGFKEEGQGLDRAEIEPPYHDGEVGEYYDIGDEKLEDQG
ncbi:MAG: hypothetical protein REI64_16460 [Pedobacter sp.]|uniref:hypothetical protein n=1 Tax=Pedobacter sp. TaxID=1411316 RepID=UPI002808E639|nr:hypothetical protein [Pedobacter sp.]MDQ8006397.1 hypothetical protein [Pedobacter sp.]